MRTNIEIEDELMEQALSVSGKTTKKDVVEAGLKLLVQIHKQTAIRHSNEHTTWLDREAGRQRIGVTDGILFEVLQGSHTEARFARTLQKLSEFEVFNSGGEALAIARSQNYRFLRSQGKTVRIAIDCLIATFCLAHGHQLLHRDKDFDSFEEHLGLSVLHPSR